MAFYNKIWCNTGFVHNVCIVQFTGITIMLIRDTMADMGMVGVTMMDTGMGAVEEAEEAAVDMYDLFSV